MKQHIVSLAIIFGVLSFSTDGVACGKQCKHCHKKKTKTSIGVPEKSSKLSKSLTAPDGIKSKLVPTGSVIAGSTTQQE